MRRVFVRILLLLVIGAVINVAVAWGLAIRPNPFLSEFYGPNGDSRAPLVWSLGDDVTRWYCEYPGEVHVAEFQPRQPLYSRTALSREEFDETLPAWSLLCEREPSRDNLKLTSYNEFAAGWPVPSLCFREWNEPSSLHSARQEQQAVGKIEIPSHWLHDSTLPPLSADQRRNELPCIPIWPGFHVNTLLYACAAWLVFFAPFAAMRRAKRARRHRKGLCLRCGYDLRGSVAMNEQCPECGAVASEPRP